MKLFTFRSLTELLQAIPERCWSFSVSEKLVIEVCVKHPKPQSISSTPQAERPAVSGTGVTFDRKGEVWNMQRPRGREQGWGHTMFWFQRPDDGGWGIVHGHMEHPRPDVGDRVECLMTSGKWGLFDVVSSRHPNDPPDQYFCDVQFVGYREES